MHGAKILLFSETSVYYISDYEYDDIDYQIVRINLEQKIIENFSEVSNLG